VGASGGPKWFVLAGLDRVIFPEFFKGRQTPIETLGSSAGAWRFACFAQKDPLAAINRLAEGYSTTVYGKKAKVAEITEKSRELLGYVLQGNAIEEIVQNPKVKSNIVVARCKGLTRFDNRFSQLMGLLPAAIGNRIERRQLSHFFSRVIMTSSNEQSFNFDDGLGNKRVSLTKENYKQSLMATGAIPLVISGVKDIAGAPSGVYRDGGIIDYHFDINFAQTSINEGMRENSLVLYPHFYAHCKPGWFDKGIRQRFVQPHHYDNVVMLTPSEDFVRSLPYGKIPDRKDFSEMDANTRIKYWQTVIRASDRLGEEFIQLTEHSESIDKYIKPMFA